ncbi:diflavin oxidoreductase [Granulicella tundricola]|uniref:assimilatory sulfite reductase (NADPH) n=1 Tax=Granulicella tundricola (strain ATCC BAA-1859 / DSM 23138 / MP5ACTX9) TaxID=1198114 RepID=E8X206_GRATM|nr:oxidoreductase [Granulicella tundricola]ADW69167.1 oxidoreductase FAD/NAD(P)-binding domain protein [Granulicella tundricola MP5ACTX9]
MSETLEATTESAAAPAAHAPKYTRNNPYQSNVLVNELLTAEGSEKETRHVELSLEDGMTYTPGDAVGILPENRREVVDEMLQALGFTGSERVLDHYKVEIDLDEALRTRLAIGKLERGRITQMVKLAPENAGLKAMAGADNKARAEEYCYGREFIDLVKDFPGIITQPQQLFQILARLTPRMYSIASSQALHADNVQTTVRVVRYDAHGRSRQGLASGHLGERAPVGGTMPIFLHANGNFRLPEDSSKPVIMVGPGTGVAPFRAFLEERQAKGETGDNWLFFGEQRRALDFLYQEQFEGMHKDGVLTRLETAFSRDQAKKIYVQDRIEEHAAEVYAWLERGAYFYVCGDATRMAKDVHTALLDAIAKGSNGTLEHAEEYLATMKKQKRYQLDVY